MINYISTHNAPSTESAAYISEVVKFLAYCGIISLRRFFF
jgi:hypothetical protein